MDTQVDLGSLSKLLQGAIFEAMKEKSLEDLQVLDWFTWNTDFFLEQRHKKAA